MVKSETRKLATIRELSQILREPVAEHEEWFEKHPEFEMPFQKMRDILLYLKENVIDDAHYDEDGGHGKKHIYTVMADMVYLAVYAGRRLEVRFDFEMIAVIAAYHDYTLKISGRENHEKESARALMKSQWIEDHFGSFRMVIMALAIIGHRASISISEDIGYILVKDAHLDYTRMLRDADRTKDTDELIERSFGYQVTTVLLDTEEKVLAGILAIAKEKYGGTGYAGKPHFIEMRELSDKLASDIDDGTFEERAREYVPKLWKQYQETQK